MLFCVLESVVSVSSYHSLVSSPRFGGSLLSLLRTITVSCPDFVSLCRHGSQRRPMSGDECCGRFFAAEGVFTYDGKCFTTQGVLNYTVYFPGKAQGITVGVRETASDVTARLDATVSDWLSTPLSRRGVAFAVSDRSAHPTVAMAMSEGGRGARLGAVADVAVRVEAVDFTQTQYPLRSILHGEEKCLGEGEEEEGADLAPGFQRYSMDNCKAGKIQRGANYFYGCNLVTFPTHCDG